MTPLEYVEVSAVEAARWRAKETVMACRTTPHVTKDPMSWKRYTWALADELCREGLDGVR
jgi:hypothetical protein